MNYEKKYKEALELARKLYNMRGDWTNLEIESIFPELRKSEDEKIRKFLIQMAQNGHGEDKDWWNKCVAWLEKQGDIVKNNMLLPFKEYDNLMDSINKKKKEGYEAGYKQGLSDSKGEQRPILDIEIPFGAKDSELIEESISIPKGCYAIIKDNKIVIRKELCHQD